MRSCQIFHLALIFASRNFGASDRLVEDISLFSIHVNRCDFHFLQIFPFRSLEKSLFLYMELYFRQLVWWQSVILWNFWSAPLHRAKSLERNSDTRSIRYRINAFFFNFEYLHKMSKKLYHRKTIVSKQWPASDMANPVISYSMPSFVLEKRWKMLFLKSEIIKAENNSPNKVSFATCALKSLSVLSALRNWSLLPFYRFSSLRTSIQANGFNECEIENWNWYNSFASFLYCNSYFQFFCTAPCRAACESLLSVFCIPLKIISCKSSHLLIFIVW